MSETGSSETQIRDASVPPGWYSHPDGSARLKWWTGVAWAEWGADLPVHRVRWPRELDPVVNAFVVATIGALALSYSFAAPDFTFLGFLPIVAIPAFGFFFLTGFVASAVAVRLVRAKGGRLLDAGMSGLMFGFVFALLTFFLTVWRSSPSYVVLIPLVVGVAGSAFVASRRFAMAE